MRDNLFPLLLIAALVSTVVSPWVICRKLDKIAENQRIINATIESLDDDGDDDPDDGESEPAEPDNVVAIGKRAA